MDAVPVTLGQEFSGYAAQIRLGGERVDVGAAARRADPARRHRHRHRAEHPPRVRRARARAAGRGHRPAGRCTRRPVRGAGQPRRARRALGRSSRSSPSRSRRSPTTSPDGLRPAHRPRRAAPARAAEGLVDHARQGQPRDPGGRAPGVRPGDRQRHGDHDRRHAGQLRAQRAHPADRAQPAPVDHAARERVELFAEKCIDGLEADEENCIGHAESTLAIATALNPHIGYDKATRDRQGGGRLGAHRSARSRSRRASTRRRSTRRST